jgi:hypothetical protein
LPKTCHLVFQSLDSATESVSFRDKALNCSRRLKKQAFNILDRGFPALCHAVAPDLQIIAHTIAVKLAELSAQLSLLACCELFVLDHGAQKKPT